MAAGVYSTVPLVIQQLQVTLAARKALTGVLDGVLVLDGLPGEPPAEREVIYIDDPVEVQRDWAQLGGYAIDESYNLNVLVEVIGEGDDRTATRNRFFAVVAEIEQAAVLDITMAGILNWGIKPGPMNPVCAPYGDAAWIAKATLQLQCSGRIRAS